MALTNAGRDQISAEVIGETPTAFNNANGHLAAGDSAAAFAATQTDLQAGANKFRRPMDATFPTRATNVVTARATFGASEANFAWNEWGWFNASSGGTMMSRKVEALGTKASPQVWQLTCTLTFAAA